jgi:hypothetical protein
MDISISYREGLSMCVRGRKAVSQSWCKNIGRERGVFSEGGLALVVFFLLHNSLELIFQSIKSYNQYFRLVPLKKKNFRLVS